MPILTPEERFGQLVAARYRLQEVLSTGGMGVLFRAVDEQSGQHVAVKMLKPVYALEPDRVARFTRETRIAAELRHPNLVAVLDVWTDETGVPFLIMELLEGCSLAQELEVRGKLPFDEAVAIARPIIDALAAAHAVGVIHRDIKPSNIFLCSDREGRLVPKLLDFGIAKCRQDDFDTQTGLVLGTPGYMAPEQALLGECSVASDVWGLGAVLHHCVSGHPPHASDSMADLLRKLVREPVPPLVGLELSKPARATIDRALMRDPHRRYATMRAFGQALTAALGHECQDSTFTEARNDDTQAELVAERESQPTSPPRGFPQQVALVAAGVLVVLLLAWTLEPHSAGDIRPLARAEAQSASLDVPQPNAALDATPTFFAASAETSLERSSSLTAAAPAALVEQATVIEAAKQPARRALRHLARAASAPRSRTVPSAAASKNLAEPEATTGLPVATEW